MSDQDSTIFNADQATQTATTSQADTGSTSTTTTQAEEISLLVGEGRKYKTVDELAKAYLNADSFIEQLKAENQELRSKTVEAKTIDEVLERLTANQSNAATATAGEPASSTNGLSAEDVAKIVQQTVTGLETAKIKEGNIKKADAEMRKIFGDKAGEVYKSVAKTPELHNAYMKLAEADPSQFVALFTKEQGSTSQGSQVDSGSSVNTTTTYTSGNNVRENTQGTKEYYSKIRREDPKRYYSQQVQLEMNRSATSDPKKYFGN